MPGTTWLSNISQAEKGFALLPALAGDRSLSHAGWHTLCLKYNREGLLPVCLSMLKHMQTHANTHAIEVVCCLYAYPCSKTRRALACLSIFKHTQTHTRALACCLNQETTACTTRWWQHQGYNKGAWCLGNHAILHWSRSCAHQHQACKWCACSLCKFPEETLGICHGVCEVWGRMQMFCNTVHIQGATGKSSLKLRPSRPACSTITWDDEGTGLSAQWTCKHWWCAIFHYCACACMYPLLLSGGLTYICTCKYIPCDCMLQLKRISL